MYSAGVTCIPASAAVVLGKEGTHDTLKAVSTALGSLLSYVAQSEVLRIKAADGKVSGIQNRFLPQRSGSEKIYRSTAARLLLRPGAHTL
jgi:hypothetical protein